MLTAILIFTILCFLVMCGGLFAALYIIGQNNTILLNHKLILKGLPENIRDTALILEKSKSLFDIIKNG